MDNAATPPAATWRITATRPNGQLELHWQCGADECQAIGVVDDFGRVVVLA